MTTKICRQRRPRTRRLPLPALVAALVAPALWPGIGSAAQQPASGNSPAPAPQKAPPQGSSQPAPSQGGQAKPGQPPNPPAAGHQPQGQQTAPQKPSPQPPSGLQLEAPPTAAPQKPAPAQPQPAAPGQPQPQAKPLIDGILFRGNRRIPQATIRAHIFSHKGDVYDENALERDFQSLWNTGFFDDIRAEVTDEADGGKTITFFVREKKLVRSIDYKGLSSVQQSDVLDRFREKKVGLTILSQYDPVVIKRAEVVLEELLAEHGHQFATVTARTRNIPPNSVALTFIVVEGPKVKVGNIRFAGNTVFSNLRLVRAMKYTKPAGVPPWFYWFHKTYDKDKADYDLEQVRELYQDHGYYKVVVKEPLTKMTNTVHHAPLFLWSWGHGKRVDLTIGLEEGPQYHLGRVVIRGAKLFKPEALANGLQMKQGDVFNMSKVRKGLENYRKLYGAYGYINFTATPDPEEDPRRHIINLALDFEEGQQFKVHRIEFTGNTKTRDKVIRRELMVDEGAIFSTTLWDYSVLRMNQLGFFDEIKKEDYDIKQNHENNTVDINVKVKEKGRNSIGFSGGVSGLAGNFVGINYATNNFLGLGETLSIETTFGTYQKLYSFGFTEPYLFERPITAGFTVYKSDYHFNQLQQLSALTGINYLSQQNTAYGQIYQNFQQNSTGGTVFVSYPMHKIPFARAGLTYQYSVSSVQTFNAATQSLFQELNYGQFKGPNQLRGITTSQIMPTFTYDRLTPNAMNPHSGKSINASLGFSGSILGGNVNTITPRLEFKYFHPINHGRNTLGFHLVGTTITGFGGKEPPPFNRLYMGGEYDVRGFDIYTISPIAFFPTIGQVCNRDNAGNQIWAVGANGQKQVGTCGSYTQFPYNTLQFPGGDTEVFENFEYRIPIIGPVTLVPFFDAGVDFIAFQSQLKLQNGAGSQIQQINQLYPWFPTPDNLKPVGVSNFRPRGSTGIELDVVLPVVNAPFRVWYGYNVMRLNANLAPPTAPAQLRSLFPNDATYDAVLPYFRPFNYRDQKSRLGFTVARQF